MDLSGTVSVVMALLLSCFVMAKPEKHTVGREPVLSIAGGMALAQGVEESRAAAELTCTSINAVMAKLTQLLG